MSPEKLARSNFTMEIFILLFSIALYANTLWSSYTLDDALMITQNAYTKQGLSGIKSIMTHDAFTGFFGEQKQLVAGGRYRPLSQVIFAMEYQLGGLSPFTGHLVNLLAYAFIALLLFRILRKLIPEYHHGNWQRSVPFLATALFVAHPLHTEVVANIKGLDELMSLGFSLLLLHFSLRFIDKKNTGNLAASALFFLLALLSKENAITFVAVVFLCIYFFRKPSVKDYLLSMLPFIAAFPFYLILRINALGYLTSTVAVKEVLNDPYLDATTAQHWATNIFTWGKYLMLLVFPHPLTHDYYPWHITLRGWSDPGSLLSLLAYAAMIFFALLGLKQKKLWSFAILLFLITFSISSNVAFNIGTFMNERFMFVPSLGFTIILAMLFTNKLTAKKKATLNHGKGLIYISIILLCLYSVKTFTRNFAWKNDYSLFTTDVKTSENSTKCNVSAGGVLIDKARSYKTMTEKEPYLQQAETYLRKAVEIYPGNFAGWVLLGNVYLERKDYSKAKEYYLRCLSVNNELPEALTKLNYVGYRLSEKGDQAGSMEAFKALSLIQPKERKHLIQIADALSKSGKTDTAMVVLKNLLASDSSFADAWSKMGEIYGRVFNNIALSEYYLMKAYRLDSTSLTTCENLGIVKGMKKEYALSLRFLNKALSLDSANPRIMNNIASTYFMMGQKAEAEAYGKKAKEATAKENNK